MMMKSIKMLLMSAVLLSLSATGSAQTMEQWWLNMPDTLFSYINKSKRIEAMDYRNMGLKLDVTNLLKGSTLVDTLTNDYIEVKLNEAALLQMSLLPKDSDTVVCVVSTFYGPEAESQICYYDRTWRRVGEEQTDSLIDAYVFRPDTMSMARYEELKKLIEPVMVKATLSIQDDTLLKELSLPLLTKEEKQTVKAILKQRKLKWRNGMFIEC